MLSLQLPKTSTRIYLKNPKTTTILVRQLSKIQDDGK